MSLILLFSSLCFVPATSLDALGIYRETSLTMFKSSQGYLVNSASEGVAVVFHPERGVVGRFQKQGQGPGEFFKQFVFRIQGDTIEFCSNGRFLLSFDGKLNPRESDGERLPLDLPPKATMGIPWKANSVLISLAGEAHFFVELTRQQNGWKLGKRLLPTPLGKTDFSQQFLASGYRSLIHNQTVFTAKLSLNQSEQVYEIQVFANFLATGTADVPSVVLAADVTEFTPFLGMRALIANAAKTQAGFVVELVTDLQRDGTHQRWHDHFGPNGHFIERRNANGSQLLPVSNHAEVFQIQDFGQDRIIVPLQ